MPVGRPALAVAVLLTAFLWLIGGVAFGDSYFQRKLFQPSGEKVEQPIALSADGNTALFGGYLQTRSGDEWVQQRQVTEGGYMNSLSADGDTLVSSVGGLYFEEAFVYTRSGGVWGNAVRLEPEGLAGKEPEFGAASAVSANGGTVLVGAPESREIEAAGRVVAFVRDGETWTQEAILQEDSARHCGDVLALSADGDTAVIGCENANHSGRVDQIFARTETGWTLQANVSSRGAGIALAPDGETLFTAGETVRIYQRGGEAWSFAGEIQPLPPGESGLGPIAIAPEGTHLLIEEGLAGAVLYEGSGADWTAVEGLLPVGFEKLEYNSELALSTDAQVILASVPAPVSTYAGGVWEFTPGEPVRGPEIGRCVLHPRVSDGAFTDAACSKQLPKKGTPYEWTPGAVKAGLTLAGGALTLSTHSKQSITCSGLSGSGVLGRKELSGLHLSLTGCQKAEQQCTSTMASPGQIDSEELEGALGVETEKPKRKIGIELSAPGVFAAFTCGTTSVSIRGAVIGSVKAGNSGSSLTINFKASNGAQKPNHFVGGPEEKLEASFAGGAYEAIGLRAKPTQTYEEPLEINPAY